MPDIVWSNKTIRVKLDADNILLFSTITGAVDIINSKVMSNVDSGTAPDDIYSRLKSRGHCFHSYEEMRNVESKIHEIVNKSEQLQTYRFVIIPNYSCNFACDYCYETNATMSKNKVASRDLDKIFSAINLIFSRDERPGSIITLMGGEPLLSSNQEIIKEICLFTSEKDFKIEFITNGATLIDYVSLLARFRNKITGIQVTLDGPEYVHNQRRPFKNRNPSFATIINGIKSCLQSGLRISLRINLDSRNIGYVPELLNFLTSQQWYDRKLIRSYLYPMSDGGCLGSKFIEKEHQFLIKLLAETDWQYLKHFGFQFHGVSKFMNALNSRYKPCLRYCDAERSQYVFDPFGYIYKCWFGIRSPSDFAIGKYKPKFFLDGARESLWVSRTSLNMEKCKDCIYCYICGGGCAEKAWEECRQIDTSRCPDYENLIPYIVNHLWTNKALKFFKNNYDS